jgi:DNA-binding GntR family transcriptional regulator
MPTKEKTISERQSDKAYRMLKKAILSLELPPGSLLVEQDLLSKYGIGRTPLRETLQRLSIEGLVTSLPRRGMFVSFVTEVDVHAVYELRCELDAFAAWLAAERATEQEIAVMEKMLETASKNDSEELVSVDDQLHTLIVNAAHNALLADIHRRIYDQSVRQFNLRHYQRETLLEMHTEIGAVVASIRNRNPREAAEAAANHVRSRGWFPDAHKSAPERSFCSIISLIGGTENVIHKKSI